MKKHPQLKEICSATRKTLKLFKSSWALKIENKLVDLEDRYKRNNLRINEKKEGESKTWEECEERINCFLKEKLNSR